MTNTELLRIVESQHQRLMESPDRSLVATILMDHLADEATMLKQLIANGEP